MRSPTRPVSLAVVAAVVLLSTAVSLCAGSRADALDFSEERMERLKHLPLTDLAEVVAQDTERVRSHAMGETREVSTASAGKGYECFYTMRDLRECNELYEMKESTLQRLRFQARAHHYRVTELETWCMNDHRWTDHVGIVFVSAEKEHRTFCSCVIKKKQCDVNAATRKQEAIPLKDEVAILKNEIAVLKQEVIPSINDKLRNATGSGFNIMVKKQVLDAFIARDNSFTAAMQRVMAKVNESAITGLNDTVAVTDGDILSAGGNPDQEFRDLSKEGSWLKIWKSLQGGGPRNETDGSCPENQEMYQAILPDIDNRTIALFDETRKRMGCGVESGFFKLLIMVDAAKRRVIIRELHDVEPSTLAKVVSIMLDRMDVSKTVEVDKDVQLGKTTAAVTVMNRQMEHSLRAIDHLKMSSKNMREVLLNMEKMMQFMMRKQTGEDKLAAQHKGNQAFLEAEQCVAEAKNIVKKFYGEDLRKLHKKTKKVARRFKKVRHIMVTDLKRLGKVHEEESDLDKEVQQDANQLQTAAAGGVIPGEQAEQGAVPAKDGTAGAGGAPPSMGDGPPKEFEGSEVYDEDTDDDSLVQVDERAWDHSAATSRIPHPGPATSTGGAAATAGGDGKEVKDADDKPSEKEKGDKSDCKGGECDDMFGDLEGAGKKMFRPWDAKEKVKHLYAKFLRLVKRTKKTCYMLYGTKKILKKAAYNLAARNAKRQMKNKFDKFKKVDEEDAKKEMGKIDQAGKKKHKKKCACKSSDDERPDSQTEERMETMDNDPTVPDEVTQPMEDAGTSTVADADNGPSTATNGNTNGNSGPSPVPVHPAETPRNSDASAEAQAEARSRSRAAARARARAGAKAHTRCFCSSHDESFEGVMEFLM